MNTNSTRALKEVGGSFVLISDNLTQFVKDGEPSNALWFDCPCGEHSNCIAFEPTLHGAPLAASGLSANNRRWQRDGETLNTITLSPSISIKNASDTAECWHGWVRNGEVQS